MKISDLYENKKSQYDDQLKRQIMDVLVLYNVTGTNKTNVLNIVSELEKEGTSVDVDTITTFIQELGFEVKDEVVFFDNSGGEDPLTDGEEFDPISDLASTATDKRMK